MSVFLLRHSVSRLCSDDHVLRLVSKRHERPAPTVCIFCGSKGFPHLCHTPNKTRTRGNSTRHTPCVTNRKTRQVTGGTEEDCVWNVMAHSQKRDFVFRRNGGVHLNRQGRQFSRLLAAEVCASAVVMLDTPCSEVVWRVLATLCIRQFPLHFPSRASPCAITFQLDSTKSCPLLRLNKTLILRKVSLYSDLLRAAWAGDRMPLEATFSAPVQTGPEAHLASYIRGMGSVSRG